MIVSGTSSIPIIATTNALPLNSTARLEVAPAPRDRVVLLETARALLAVAREHEERVVDPERQPHPGRACSRRRSRGRTPARRGPRQPERDDDRDDRQQQRDEPRDDRAEDEQQDDQRGGQTELSSPVLQVVLRELVEVVVAGLDLLSPRRRTTRSSSARSARGFDRSGGSLSGMRTGIGVACRSAETCVGSCRLVVDARKRDGACLAAGRRRAWSRTSRNCSASTV